MRTNEWIEILQSEFKTMNEQSQRVRFYSYVAHLVLRHLADTVKENFTNSIE
jgi:hypothetical protein